MVSFTDLFQIVLIDLTLAGDNALVIGMAVAALPSGQKHRTMIMALIAATLLRVILACFAVQILHITGLLIAGGLLLLWVGWKLARDLHFKTKGQKKPAAQKTSEALWRIVIADVTMSLDNVLGVVGVARDHMVELVIGLSLSVALMGVASTQVARLTARYPKIAYIGVFIILIAALRMIYEGTEHLPPLVLA